MKNTVKKKKNKSEGFMKSVLVLMISQVFIKLLGFIYRVYLTNREGFGDEGNAIYSGGYLIYAVLLTISSIGVPNAISKLVSEKIAIGDNRGASRILKIGLMTFGLIGLFRNNAPILWRRIHSKRNLANTRIRTNASCTISRNLLCKRCISNERILQW